MQNKMYFDLYLPLYTKIDSKCIIGLNVKPKTIQLLENKAERNICDLGLGKGFLATTPKHNL